MSKIKITKTEAKRYFIVFLIAFVSLMFALCVDNILWINGSPEWDSTHTVSNSIGEWTGAVSEYSTIEKIDYVLKYRVYTVLTNYRDITASLIFAGIISLLVIFSNEILGKRVLHRSFIK